MSIVLLLACLTLSTFTQTHAYFTLRYACKPNGDISALNVDTDYRSVHAFNVLGTCDSEIINNYTVIKITNCPKDDHPLTTRIILSKNEHLLPYLIGGKNAITRFAKCTFGNSSVANLVEVDMSVRGLFRQVSDFSPGFYKRNPSLKVELFDVTGEPGYTIFTTSYPIAVVITGPPESDIFPEVCVAYPSDKYNEKLSTTIIRDGCSLENGYMFSFTSKELDWFDRNQVGQLDMDRFVLGPDMFHDVMYNEEEEEEEAEPLPAPPTIFTHAFAFRFYLSSHVYIRCEVRICPPGTNHSDNCVLPCDSAATTTVTPQTTTAVETTTEHLTTVAKQTAVKTETTPAEDEEEEKTTKEYTQTTKVMETTTNQLTTISQQSTAGQKDETKTEQTTTPTQVQMNDPMVGEEEDEDSTESEVVNDVSEQETTTATRPKVDRTATVDPIFSIGLFDYIQRKKRETLRHTDDSIRRGKLSNDNHFIIGRGSIEKSRNVWDTILSRPRHLVRRRDQTKENKFRPTLTTQTRKTVTEEWEPIPQPEPAEIDPADKLTEELISKTVCFGNCESTKTENHDDMTEKQDAKTGKHDVNSEEQDILPSGVPSNTVSIPVEHLNPPSPKENNYVESNEGYTSTPTESTIIRKPNVVHIQLFSDKHQHGNYASRDRFIIGKKDLEKPHNILNTIVIGTRRDAGNQHKMFNQEKHRLDFSNAAVNEIDIKYELNDYRNEKHGLDDDKVADANVHNKPKSGRKPAKETHGRSNQVIIAVKVKKGPKHGIGGAASGIENVEKAHNVDLNGIVVDKENHEHSIEASVKKAKVHSSDESIHKMEDQKGDVDIPLPAAETKGEDRLKDKEVVNDVKPPAVTKENEKKLDVAKLQEIKDEDKQTNDEN